MTKFFLNGLKSAAALVIVAGSIMVLNFPAINSSAKNAVYSVLGPVERGIWNAGAGIYGFVEPLSKMNSAAAENERLHEQVNDLLVKAAQISDLKKENDFLREGLNLELDKDFDLKLADIIAKDVANDTLIINKGSRDMIDSGMPVITSQKALVGKISKVYDSFSEVTLVTSKNFSFDVRIGDGVDGLVKGQGKYCAGIDLVPRDKGLKADDPVYTSALGGIFPAGLLVGTVKEVYRNDVETFQSAALSLAFDAGGSRQVFVANGKLPLGMGTNPQKKQ